MQGVLLVSFNFERLIVQSLDINKRVQATYNTTCLAFLEILSKRHEYLDYIIFIINLKKYPLNVKRRKEKSRGSPLWSTVRLAAEQPSISLTP